ncbi:MAG TPA: HlyD family secretion protein [Acetobacteraceae bacterium]|nr:HlyD family secretion protein [Acetobacteraceae bacterium]
MNDQVVGRVLPEDAISRPDASSPGRQRGGRQLALAALGLGALMAVGYYGYDWWIAGRFTETTNDAYVGGDVTPIAPHVAGFVRQILVADNQRVEAGQTLIRLDPRDFQAALNHAEAVLDAQEAALASAQARRVQQQSVIDGVMADLTARQAQAAFAAAETRRYSALVLTAAGSRQNAEKALAEDRAARAAVIAAQAALRAAKQQLAVLDTELAQAKANVGQASAGARTARLNLGYTDIAAPVAGYVGDRSAQVGAYVAAGTNLLSVVPASGLWIDANFKEDQIARMRPGDAARIVADVLPGRTLHGHVESLAPATGAVFSVIPPQNATGNFTKIVQRVPVRVGLDGDAAELGLLRPGLSTTVSVNVRTRAP